MDSKSPNRESLKQPENFSIFPEFPRKIRKFWPEFRRQLRDFQEFLMWIQGVPQVIFGELEENDEDRIDNYVCNVMFTITNTIDWKYHLYE